MSCKAEAPSVEAWSRRTPPPATMGLLDWLRENPDDYGITQAKYGLILRLQRIEAEWPAPAKEPAHE
jgi:hypothetical protein